MAAAKKKNKRSGSHQNKGNGKPVNPFGPWKRSWYVLWGFITVVGELILISLVRNKIASLNALQIIVFAVCIPIVTHMLISGLRKLLYLSSPSKPTK
jgi:hypothetical protein